MKQLLILLLVLCGTAQAANVFVRSGAGGSNNGSNWTDAYTSMPTVSANNVYYIADGSYGGVTIAASSVTIKKCSTTDGVSSGVSGYNSTYCDGKATFSGGVTTSGQRSNVVIDGSYRNESNWSDYAAYGFTLAGGFDSIDDFGSTYCVTELTIKYAHLGPTPSTSYSVSYPDQVLKGTGYRSPNCRAWTVHRNLLTNAAHYCLFCANSFNGAVIEYNRFQYGWGKEAIRGQITFGTSSIRWNQFVDSCGQGGGTGEGCTAEIAIWDDCSGGSCDNNKIYGNYFYRTRDENSGGTIVVGGNGGSWVGSSANNTLIYNNTIAGIGGGGVGGNILVNGGSGNVCRNNLWWDTISASVTCSTTSNNVDAGANPFVSYSTGNLRLSGATSAGTTLSSPYDVDMDGVARGGDGTWDVGAFEYNASGSPPNAPSNFRLVNWAGWLLILGGMGGLFRSIFNGKSNLPGGGLAARRRFGRVASGSFH